MNSNNLFEIGIIYERGLVRKNNEDFYSINNKKNIYILSDGMGGHNKGDVASKIIVNSFEEILKDNPMGDLQSIVEIASKQILKYCMRNGLTSTIGGTVSGITHLEENRFRYFSMGDSRIYLLEQENLKQISTDDIVYNEHNTNVQQSVLSKAIGNFKPFDLEVGEIKLQNDNILLLCSDGIYQEIDDIVLSNILRRNPLQEGCDKIKDIIFNNGAGDNFTLIALKYKG